MKSITLQIEGMSCIACENKIESTLLSTMGIGSIKASYKRSTVSVIYDEVEINLETIKKIIQDLGYKVIEIKEKHTNKNSKVLGAVLVIFALFYLLNRFNVFNLFNFFPQAEEKMGYGMLFIIGLLTSFHCIAMCGGISLSQCIPKNKRAANKSDTLYLSLLYNVGRVISYTVIGGVVGAIGSVVTLVGPFRGVVQLIAGTFMIIMGLNLLNVFPFLRELNPHMPKAFAKLIGNQKKGKGPLIVGLLNGLMPCGPLQAMQIYALSTGSSIKGALAMFLFSLGTVPLMFVLGALSTYLSKKFATNMVKFSAVLVVVLGIFMLNNGLALSGVNMSFSNSTVGGSVATIENGVQKVTTRLSSGRYEPITVQKGVPVKWIIKAEKSDINGCNNEIVIPKFNKEVKLKEGENVIEFTPAESGSFAYSCWMGMIKSAITVVDDIESYDGGTVNTVVDSSGLRSCCGF